VVSEAQGPPPPPRFFSACNSGRAHPSAKTVEALIEATVGIIGPLDRRDCAIYGRVLAQVTSLDLSFAGVDDLAMIAELPALEELTLQGNTIRDFTPLLSLKRLQHLDLFRNSISSLKGIDSFHNLTYLQLRENAIQDVTFVASLTHLERLYLEGNKITDITPLASLVNLEVLGLSGNRIKDISALKSLTGLMGLYVDENEISNVRFPWPPKLVEFVLSGNPLGFTPGDMQVFEEEWRSRRGPRIVWSPERSGLSGCDCLLHEARHTSASIGPR
jgi:Leucine-rich repeat (LRR) protein